MILPPMTFKSLRSLRNCTISQASFLACSMPDDIVPLDVGLGVGGGVGAQEAGHAARP